MPYDNEYNRKIAAETNYNNRKFVAHSDATGQGTIDYTQSANLSGSGLYGRTLQGKGRSGGVAEFKGATANKKHCYQDDSEYSSSDEEGKGYTGGTKLGHPKQDSRETGQFDQLQGGAILGLQDETVIDGKKGKRVPKGRVNNLKQVQSSFGTLGVPADDSRTREMVGLASMPASNARLGIASKIVDSGIEGGKGGFGEGTFRDTGFGEVDGAKGGKKPRKKRQTKKDKEDEKLAMELKGVQEEEKPKKRGRKKKVSKEASKEGGIKSMAELGQERKKQKEESERIRQERETKKGRGRPKKVEGGANPRMVGGTTTNTKRTLQSTSKAELSGPVPKAQMPSSTLSGFGKKGKSARAEIVRKVMKDKGLKLIEASKYVKAHNLY